jgi:Predicted ATPase with chaperone activity
MNHVTLHAAYFFRGDIIPCTVEVGIDKGIGIHVIGMPDAVVKEMLIRVTHAMQASGYSLPGKKIIISIEPHGGHEEWAGAIRPRDCFRAFDLAIALGILIAADKLPRPKFLDYVDYTLFFATIRLDGSLAAPYTGIDEQSAAAVLDWQLRRNWDKIVGFPACIDNKTIYADDYPTLLSIIEAIQGGVL